MGLGDNELGDNGVGDNGVGDRPLGDNDTESSLSAINIWQFGPHYLYASLLDASFWTVVCWKSQSGSLQVKV